MDHDFAVVPGCGPWRNLDFNRVHVIVEELVLYGQVGLSQKLDGKYNVIISINIYSLTNRLNSCPGSLVYKVS